MASTHSYSIFIASLVIATACGNNSFQAAPPASRLTAPESSSREPAPLSSPELDASPQAAVDPAPTKGDDAPDEEQLAETPVVIAGAYLACTARWREKDSKGLLSCKLPDHVLRKELEAHKDWTLESSSGLTMWVGAPSYTDDGSGQASVHFGLAHDAMQTLVGEIFKETSHLVLKPSSQVSVNLNRP